MYPYIDLFGRKIGTYGLCLVIGIFLAGWLSLRRGRKCGLRLDDLLIIAAFALLFALPCGGILYAFVTYTPIEIWRSVLSGDFSVFGGLVYYGGLTGGIIGANVGIRVAKVRFSVAERSVVPYIPLGHAIGRIGCLLAGCCNGMPYDGPFAVYYPNGLPGSAPGQGYFPVQPLEAIVNLCICAALTAISRKERRSGVILSSYLGFYAVLRFSLEFLRGDSIRGMYGLFSTSQWIAVGMLVCSLVYLLKVRKKKS